MTTSRRQLLTALPRGVVIGFEIMVVLAVMIAGALTFFLYRVASGPIDLEFAREFLSEALSSPHRSVTLDFDRAALSWPNLQGPLRLDLKNLMVTTNGKPNIAVRDISLALAKAPLLIGRVRPERLIVRAPILTFDRTVDGQIKFSFQEQQQGTGMPLAGVDATGLILAFLRGDQLQDFGILSRIREVEIERAQIRVADQAQGMTWRLNDVDLSLQTVDVGVYGSVDVQLPNGQHFSLVLTYQRARDHLNIAANFRDFSLPSFAGRLFGIDLLRRARLPLTGSFEISGQVEDLRLDRLHLDARSAAGQVDTQRVIGTDLPITGVRVKIDYDHPQGRWDVADLAFNIGDVPVRASGGMTKDAQGAYTGALDFRVDQIALKTIQELWPASARDLPIGTWITQKLSGATFTEIEARLPIWAGRKERQLTFLAMHPTVEFAFKDLRADYRAPLSPLEEGGGTATFNHDRLAFHLTRGKIRDLDVRDTTLAIHDVTKAGAGLAEIRADVKGPLKTVLHYIALDPINLGGKLPVKIEDVSGAGRYIVDVAFPTLHDLPADLVEVDVAARLDNLVLPGLVRGQTLAGGPFDLNVQDGMINLKGSGTLAARQVTFDMTQPVDPKGHETVMQVRASVDADNNMRRAFGADLDFLQGAAKAEVTYVESKDGTERIDIDADLTGTRILFDALAYEKAPGLPARARLILHAKKGAVIKAENLMVDAPGAIAKNGTLGFGMIDGAVNLTAATLPSLTLGRTIARVTYKRDATRMMIDVTGKRLDLAPFLSAKKDPSAGPVLTLEAQVDDLYLAGEQALTRAQLNVHLNARADLESLQLMGTAGTGPASIRYVPDDQGRMTFNLQAADAGAFLRVMDIYPNLVGGTLALTGSPIGNNNRDVKGDLVIRDFGVVKAPVLAQLLGSMSPEGVNEQLQNQGLRFDRLESGFAWLRRPNMDLMSFREGRTSGSALGLTFDGLYDRRKESIEINGTIIPVSGINTLVSNIPLVGDLLLGGRGSALFAATYSIKGPASDPKTTINPLSVLTPGILRKIFFENTPKDPLKSGGTATQAGKKERRVN